MVAILVSQNNETAMKFPQKGEAYYQILPLIHEDLKGESTSLSKVTCGAALFQATLQYY